MTSEGMYIYIHVMRMAAQLCKVNSKVIRKTVKNGWCPNKWKSRYSSSANDVNAPMPVSPFQTCRTLPKLAFQLPLHQVCRPRHKVRGVHTLLQRIGDPVTCLWLQGTMCHKTHPPRSPEPSACGNRQSLPNGHVPDGDRSEIGKSQCNYIYM